MIDRRQVCVFIEPSSGHYDEDRLFQDGPLNRDECLAPFRHLKEKLEARGFGVHTVDALATGKTRAERNLVYSFGGTRFFEMLSSRPDVSLRRFYQMEPPVVAPKAYRLLPTLSEHFAEIYVHNAEGIGFERLAARCRAGRLRKFHWPQTYDGPIPGLFERQGRKRLVLINSNKTPRPGHNELYSERIRAVLHFGPDRIDLFGMGWHNFNWRHPFPPYLLNRRALLAAYRGRVASKYETLASYDFAICFENMVMPGYVTEKIFDCLYAGTVPIYLGAPDITNFVPAECFIDFRDFDSYASLEKHLDELSQDRLSTYHMAMRAYLASDRYYRFSKDALTDEIAADVLAATGLSTAS
jgi:hypothetical protein